MNRTVRHHVLAVVTTTVLATGVLLAAPTAQADDAVDLSDPAAVTAAADYSCGAMYDSDQALANQLNDNLTGTLRGYMTPYRISCARAIVNTVRARGLTERAAVIAVTTSIVETTLRNNPNMEDHDSVGLFQQRASWGSFENRMDPTWATNAFVNGMLNVSNWQSRPIGEVCQAVQNSAYPDRYQVQAADGARIAGALFEPHPGPDNVGVYRPSTHEFHLRNDDGSLRKVGWGTVGDLPVSANWDGAGPDNVGIYRPSTHEFHLRKDDGSLIKVGWGTVGDQPISGNWDGGSADNVGIWRPSTHQFHLRKDDGSLLAQITWGDDGDIPVSGNWDGAGPDNVGIYRPSTREFHLRMDDGSLKVVGYGTAGDKPVSGDWDATGPENLGIWRPSSHQFHLRAADGSLLAQITWGDDGDIPVSGNWDARQ
ncbi:hypothetical protein [Streptomyces sp. ID05-47C]|uniref:hypothetical protein n=1 Tax=Streptomyces sp. ID05-47C TaxID=3028665 RepID=UPI0029A10519|nr:hypothetical protein [Streptomyces sp. ID05-47C]MDX3568797.1 hypothetical protein [Streptomyces sp. ID05-47C]